MESKKDIANLLKNNKQFKLKITFYLFVRLGIRLFLFKEYVSRFAILLVKVTIVFFLFYEVIRQNKKGNIHLR